MTDSPIGLALKTLRDTLRSTEISTEDLSSALSTTLRQLQLYPASSSSLPSSLNADSDPNKSISKYLPSIQSLLIGKIIPTFLPLFRDDNREYLITTFFLPPRSSDNLKIRRQIVLVSYLSVPGYLSSVRGKESNVSLQLTNVSRDYIFSLLDNLARTYSINDIYWAIFINTSHGESSRSGTDTGGLRRLQWEEAVRAIVGLPAKALNAVGRWKVEGKNVDLPPSLEPRAYFDRLVVRLEDLMYELSQTPHHDLSPLRLVFEKLAAIGLVSIRSIEDTRTPSLLQPLLPPLLAHLHPNSTSLPPYPTTFLPSLFRPLPTSTLTLLIDSLLKCLTLRLIDQPLEPDRPDERIKRSIQVFEEIVGPANVGGEAWNAVLRNVLDQKIMGVTSAVSADPEHARRRLIIGWVARGGDSAMRSFIEIVVDTWTDAKYVKFSLYARQFDLTHLLLLALSLMQQYSPWLVGLSHRSRLIMAFQSYLSHPDPSIRRLGMLVAEILSELTIPPPSGVEAQHQENEIDELRAGLEVDEDGSGAEPPKPAKKAELRRLKFTGIWEGNGEGREDARWLRSVIGLNDENAILDDNQGGDAWLLGWKANIKPSGTTVIATSLPNTPNVPRGRPTRGKPNLQAKIKTKPKPKIVMLDPDQLSDPLSGYQSESPSSSRSPSPTPSYLEEVAADPSLALDSSSRANVTRPVYIPQLVGLLKEREKPECLEMALKWGEGLVRAKREFGTELSENAVNVAILAMGLNDPFNIEGFDESRQGLMNALAACSPKTVAPFLCEQYFNTQYSLQQKSVILTALAMGARELAGQSVPREPRSYRSIDFPTKTLPPRLHRKYITTEDVPSSRRTIIEGGQSHGQLEEAINGLRGLILSKGAKKGEETVPSLAREKRLRVNSKRTMVAEVDSLSAGEIGSFSSNVSLSKPIIPFKDIAAEYFILPLINRFFQYFQDSSIRDSRAITTGTRYRGAGTGMVLSPLAIEKFLMTLAILLHAAKHSNVFLAVLAPEALELSLMIGAQHQPRSSNSLLSKESGAEGDEEEKGAEAQVISSILEVILVILDTSHDLDQGRTISTDKPHLVLAAGEWAKKIFENETGGLGGEISSGQGGLREGRVRAGAAGVVLKVAEIGENWGFVNRY